MATTFGGNFELEQLDGKQVRIRGVATSDNSSADGLRITASGVAKIQAALTAVGGGTLDLSGSRCLGSALRYELGNYNPGVAYVDNSNSIVLRSDGSNGNNVEIYFDITIPLT